MHKQLTWKVCDADHDVVGFALGRFLGGIGQFLVALYILGVAIQQVLLPANPAPALLGASVPAQESNASAATATGAWHATDCIALALPLEACRSCRCCHSASSMHAGAILAPRYCCMGLHDCQIDGAAMTLTDCCRLWHPPAPSTPSTSTTTSGELACSQGPMSQAQLTAVQQRLRLDVFRTPFQNIYCLAGHL